MHPPKSFSVYRPIKTCNDRLSVGQYVLIDNGKELEVLPIFASDICSADTFHSMSKITLYWVIFWGLGISLSADDGRYCTKIPVLVTPVIPVFGSNLRLENPRYQYYQYISSMHSLILTKNFNCDETVQLIGILTIEIVGPTTIQVKAIADALSFICRLWKMHCYNLKILVYVDTE